MGLHFPTRDAIIKFGNGICDLYVSPSVSLDSSRDDDGQIFFEKVSSPQNGFDGSKADHGRYIESQKDGISIG